LAELDCGSSEGAHSQSRIVLDAHADLPELGVLVDGVRYPPNLARELANPDNFDLCSLIGREHLQAFCCGVGKYFQFSPFGNLKERRGRRRGNGANVCAA
jgi:hypothetical protein